MERHEAGCTANLNRICKLHAYVTNHPAPPVSESLALLATHYGNKDYGLAELRAFVEDCPACILAALRQSGLCKGYADEEGHSPPRIGSEQFNFKEELSEMWSNHREALQEHMSSND
jgi:hypothetical protein